MRLSGWSPCFVKLLTDFYQGAVFIVQPMALPNLLPRSLSAEISEKVQPPRNMINLHFDPGESFVLESVKKKKKISV